ncbi:hypothetical protein H5410_007130 [Solanum commersonii]|uniref:inositol-phosphate phosphatase n=1 Tax=Solanum commersonii TaxID=4109 RepID=A0A9J6ABM4_SOLCO|nr:hypothetical protein H5410_007130 [Solanum commersonii]
MGRCLLSSTISSLRICQLPRIRLPAFPKSCSTNSQYGFCTTKNNCQFLPRIRLPAFPKSCSTNSQYGFCTSLSTSGGFCTKAALSEVGIKKEYSKIAADSTGSIPSSELLQVVEAAAKTGAQVVMDAVNKPRHVTYKGLTDLVTDTDKNSEVAILEVVRKNFPDHLILGEEGGIIGDSSSDYLWCIDPLDGTTNFAHGYPSFAVSVGVLFRGKPAAAAVVYAGIVSDVPFRFLPWLSGRALSLIQRAWCFSVQVEFVGGSMCWNTRIFSAAAGKGAFANGEKIHVSRTDKVEQSLLVTGFGYEHDDPWATNMELFKEFTDVSRGVRRLGAAAVDMCHVALGIAEAYWEYRLKPWDMAAGVLIVEEAGGTVSCMDGEVFQYLIDLSWYPMVCSMQRLAIDLTHSTSNLLLEKIGPATENLKSKGIDFSVWFKPENYHTEV